MNWQKFIELEKKKDYFQTLTAQINAERAKGKVIYPPEPFIFNAFDSTPFHKVKVVILGQDPYHGEGQAHGLSFSVPPKVKIPPSLKNIYKELTRDIAGFNSPEHGCLVSWAEQGVLLLNTVLTVEQSKAHSHAKFGWEIFTTNVLKTLNADSKHIVFMLWGAHAQKKGQLIERDKHTVLTSVHPSPLSAHRGFIGCSHFSQANAILIKNNRLPINWGSLTTPVESYAVSEEAKAPQQKQGDLF